MAVALDSVVTSAQGTGNLTMSVNPSGTPRGAIVFVVQNVLGSDEVTSVDYGGVAMSELSGSPNIKTTGEPSVVYAYFLGSGIPTGSQTVTVTVGGSDNKIACVIILTAAADTEVVDVDATINSDSQANPSVTLALAGRTSFAAIGLFSGQNAPAGITPLASWTNRLENDFGNNNGACYTYDTIGTADVTAGWTQTAEDAVMVAVAVSEVAAALPPDEDHHAPSLMPTALRSAALAASMMLAAAQATISIAAAGDDWTPPPAPYVDDDPGYQIGPAPQLSYWATSVTLDSGGFSAPSTIEEGEYQPPAPWIIRLPIVPVTDDDWVPPPPPAYVDDDPGVMAAAPPALSWWASSLYLDAGGFSAPSILDEGEYQPGAMWAAAPPPYLLTSDDDWVPPPVLAVVDDDARYRPPFPWPDTGITLLVLGDGSEGFAPGIVAALILTDRSMDVYHLTDASAPFHDLTDRSRPAYDSGDSSNG